VERDFGAVQDAQESGLVAEQSPEQLVERGVAGAVASEYAIEAGAQDDGLFGTGRELVVFQSLIEPPIIRFAFTMAMRCRSLAGISL